MKLVSNGGLFVDRRGCKSRKCRDFASERVRMWAERENSFRGV